MINPAGINETNCGCFTTEERDRESKMTLYMFRSISYSIPFLCDCLRMKLGYVLLGCCEVGMQMDFLFLLIRTKMLHNQYRPRGTNPPFCAYVLLKMKKWEITVLKRHLASGLETSGGKYNIKRILLQRFKALKQDHKHRLRQMP